MPVPPPLLDSRTLQDILTQLQNRAAHDVPEWTPAPEGDAGTMLQRIFARLLELALQRLNQVPEKHLLAFLDTMGVSLLPPAAATVPLTFSSTPGSPPIFVPRGMQAGTLPDGEQPAVIFETADDFTIIPAQLATAFTMDPRWDRYTDQTAALGGQSPTGFTPFVGTRRMPHVLYLGDNELLHFAKATVELDFLWELAEKSLTDVLAFLKQLTWQYTQNGQLKKLTSSIPDPNRPHLRFLDPETGEIESIDQTLVQGISEAPDIRQGKQSRWLQARLTTPFPDDPVAQALKLAQVKLTVRASGLLPDLAFSNTAPLDVTEDFLPFGEIPKVGDTFVIGSEEAFAKPDAMVTLSVKVFPLTFDWEYSSGEDEWTPLPLASRTDDTRNFTQDGTVSLVLPPDIKETKVQGESALWFRVRLAAGLYPGAPRVHEFLPPGASAPPDGFFGFAAGKRVDFKRPFFPFGEKPSPGEVFYFTSHRQPPEPPQPPVSVEIGVKLEIIPSRVQLRWDFLSANGWQPFPSMSVHGEPTPATTDGTSGFTQDGDIVLQQLPPVVAAQVNGQSSYWIRVRLTAGDYGRPTEFVPVDPKDPSKGFQPKPGTGNLNAPIITDLKLSYEAARAPASVLTQNGFLYHDMTEVNRTPTKFSPFVSVEDLTPEPYADPRPAFYLGFDAAFPEQPVTLYVAVAPRALAGRVRKETRAAVTLSAKLPALQWEYFNGTIWRELAVFDGTNHLTESGTVEFLTPPDIKPLAKFDLTSRYWLRARPRENDPQDTQRVANNPHDTQRVLGVFLNTIPAVQAATVQDQTLGSGTGQPGQTLRFTRTPVLPGQQVMVLEPEPPTDEERLVLAAEEGDDAVQERTNATTGATEIWVRWHEVANFIRSDTLSRHYTLDHTTGVLLFGDGQHGLVPPRGTNNIVATYRTGGGSAGNAPRAAIVQVKSPLPGVAAVTNPIPADGGAVTETIPMVKDRGPQTLKHRYRAVTCADLEWLARQAAGTRVARARCLPNVNRDLRFEPGWVTLLIVPQGTASKLSPSAELIRQVETYLEAHAFIGLAQQGQARVNVMGPGYLQVTVVAEVVPQDIDEAQRVKQRALIALDAFFHPLTGGPNGTGWEFGRDVYASEVSQVLQGVSGVSHVNTKTLQLTANVSQVRLTFTSAPSADMALPEGSVVMTANRQKAALLAEPVAAGSAVECIAVRGFQEGERIAKVQDLTVHVQAHVQAVTGTSITVEPFNSDTIGFPSGSVIMTFDGTRSTRLQRDILPGHAGETTIEVEEPSFASDLKSGDVLTVFYPLPMTVTSVTVAQAAGTQTLGIEPYETAVAFPVRSLLAALDNRIRLPLSTKIPAHETVTSVTLRDFIAIRGFQEGERIAKVQDLTVQSVLGTRITVEPFDSDAVDFPLDSVIMTFDGTRSTRLQQGIPPSRAEDGETTIEVEEPSFASELESGDVLTVFYPFPMTVTSVTVDQAAGMQTLGIEPYKTAVAFPVRSLLAALDNRIRLPLSTEIPANETVTSVTFASDEAITLSRRDGAYEIANLTIQHVEPVADIVYLDSNFLVYPGAHRITMVSDTNSPSRA
jgi:hypothetical protein